MKTPCAICRRPVWYRARQSKLKSARYGSCSGCDSFQAIRDYNDELPTEDEARGYLSLVRHMVQGLRPIHSDTW